MHISQRECLALKHLLNLAYTSLATMLLDHKFHKWKMETIQLRTQLIASAYSNQRMLTRHIQNTINQLVYIEHTNEN